MIEPTLPGDEGPEADLIEQHTLIEDTADDTGTGRAARLPPTPMAAAWDAPTRPISWSKQSPSRCPRRIITTPDSTADPHHRQLVQQAVKCSASRSPT